MSKILFLMAFGLWAGQGTQADLKGSHDHPLLTRMPGFYIDKYDVKEFASAAFNRDAMGLPRYTAEGKVTFIRYWIQPGVEPPSNLQVIRNYRNALLAIGAVTAWESPYNLHMKLEKDGRTAWIKVGIPHPSNHELTVVEEQAMRQDVQANAAEWWQTISNTGHAAVYGIHFDTDQAVVKPESEPALKEMAALLVKNPALKLHVVGHTDSSGELAHNMKLSEARAAAVVQALVTRYKVAPQRLRASGAGPLAPVASNRTEEGKAKNRRVELVEQ